ncbi:hypothetical protein Dimus_028861 [Dionaea muscipula]
MTGFLIVADSGVYGNRGYMPLHCFELYGVTSVVERAVCEKALKDRKRVARQRAAQVLSSDDELSDEESCASNRV